MVPVGRAKGAWSLVAALGVGLIVVLGIAGWLFHPRYPDIPSRDGAYAPKHAYEAGGPGCRPDRLGLLPNTPNAEAKRNSCAEAQREDQRAQETLSEARYASDIAEQALIVNRYQGWAIFWQAFAAMAAFIAAAIVAGLAWLAIRETRRIGEAQTRAYLTIRTAEVIFIDFSNAGDEGPIVNFVVQNNGQSPANNFVFNVVIQYQSIAGKTEVIKERELGGNWRNRLGVSVPAAVGVHEEGALVTDMHVRRFLKTIPKASLDTTMVGLKIVFEFDDIFGNHVTDEARFSGLFYVDRNGEVRKTKFGDTTWRGELHQLPTSSAWHPPGVTIV